MFDWSWIDELDGTGAADELARVRDLVIAAEAGQFLLAAHWADLHAGEFVDGCRAMLPGMPRLVDAGADGCPEIDEFAGAELAALLGRSTQGGEQLIHDAVNVRHRHPLLWRGIKAGEVRVWMAAKVARRCAAVGLNREQAVWVDAETTPYIASLPARRFFDLVEAKIIEAHPTAAEERARSRALARFVQSGMSDEDGMRTLLVRAQAGEVIYLVAVLDRIAVILGDQGDPEPMAARRVTALRILANPARALALLTGARLTPAAAEAVDPHPAHPDQSTPGSFDQFPGGELGWMRDAHGRSLPGVPDSENLPEVPLDECDLAGLQLHLPLGATVPAGPVIEQDDDPQLLRDVLVALEGFDASRLDPVTVFHVHCTDVSLKSGSGVVRVEDMGAATLNAVRDWLTHPAGPELVRQQVRVLPVLDAASVHAVDRYEIPDPMRELMVGRTPYDVFPWGTLSARKADGDHVTAYEEGGPPGQTCIENLGPLGRKHHRIKTFGGWLLVHPEPGVYWWRTRHGHWFRVDPTGTHHHGRDPDLDLRWAERQHRAAA